MEILKQKPEKEEFMKRYFRSDLACEAGIRLDNIEGTEYSFKEYGVCRIESLRIITDEASNKLGRKKGTYITLHTEKIWQISDEEIEYLSNVLCETLRKMILSLFSKKTLDKNFSVLAVGLGNSLITADAIGPMVIDKLTPTRHIKLLEPKIFDDIGICEVSAVVPGVLGKTGIESFESVKSTVETVKPNLVIVIDALAAGDTGRLATTIQLSDTGIDPGAGIGNFRSALDRETLGVPVISLGIPTVVDSSTLIYDAFNKAHISEIPEDMIDYLEHSRGYYVTPKETDLISDRVMR